MYSIYIIKVVWGLADLDISNRGVPKYFNYLGGLVDFEKFIPVDLNCVFFAAVFKLFELGATPAISHRRDRDFKSIQIT